MGAYPADVAFGRGLLKERARATASSLSRPGPGRRVGLCKKRAAL